MARTYKRDNRGRFASGGTSSSGGEAKAAKPPTRGRNRLTRDNAGRITSVGGQGATARGGRLKTAAGNKRGAVVARMSLQRSGVVGKPRGLKPGALKGKAARPATPISSAEARKQSLEKGAVKSASRAKALEVKIARLEKEYRSKDSAFYTQGVKTAERDRMHAKMQQAVKLRDEVNRLKERSRNAEQQAARIKLKPTPSSGGNARLERAMRNQLEVGPRVMRKNKKQWQKRATAIRAQKVYRTGDPVANIELDQMLRPGFREPRSRRR